MKQTRILNSAQKMKFEKKNELKTSELTEFYSSWNNDQTQPRQPQPKKIWNHKKLCLVDLKFWKRI